MKNLKQYTFLFCIILSLFSSCSKAQENSSKNETLNNKKVLIVYLSRTKNTKTVAEIIHQNIGGNLVELELENPYPENYKQIVEQVAKENETNFLPKLKTEIENIQDYDTIFIGCPTWGMQLPPPMKSFLKQYDLSAKTIIPFNTNAGYGLGNSLETIKEMSPKSKILKELSTKGGKEKDGILFVMKDEKEVQVKDEVKKWLKSLGLIN
jgi:flavodoxin